jgi:hypothetical protein
VKKTTCFSCILCSTKKLKKGKENMPKNFALVLEENVFPFSNTLLGTCLVSRGKRRDGFHNIVLKPKTPPTIVPLTSILHINYKISASIDFIEFQSKLI